MPYNFDYTTPAELAAKERRRRLLPNIIAGVLLLNPAALAAYIMAFGLTSRLVPLSIGLNIALAILYCRFRKNGKGRAAVWMLRPLAAVTALVSVLLPWTLLTGERSPWLYPVKKFVYAHGVDDRAFCCTYLPDSIPEGCTDYRLITQALMITQEYSPSVYLKFRTDSASLDSYAAKFEAQGIRPEQPTFAAFSSGFVSTIPEQIPAHAWDHLDVEHEDFSDCVIYRIAKEPASIWDSHDEGMVLNDKTGLVMYWT